MCLFEEKKTFLLVYVGNMLVMFIYTSYMFLPRDIVIHHHHRTFHTDYANEDVKITPLAYTFFLLFLLQALFHTEQYCNIGKYV